MTLQEIRDRLRLYNLKRVADAVGVPHVTVWRIAAGKTTKPTWEIVEKLRAFVQNEK